MRRCRAGGVGGRGMTGVLCLRGLLPLVALRSSARLSLPWPRWRACYACSYICLLTWMLAGAAVRQVLLPPWVCACLCSLAGFSGGRGWACPAHGSVRSNLGGTLGTEVAEQMPVGPGVARVVAVWDGDPDVAHLPFHPVEKVSLVPSLGL